MQKSRTPPYDARAIANLILEVGAEARQEIYPTTLLKVLYFAHGWHLAKFGGALVAQPFEAWKHGPVVRVVYDQLRDNAGQPLRHRFVAFDTESMEQRVIRANLPKEAEMLVKHVLAAYGGLHAFELSELTHEEDSPWDRVWRKASQGYAPGARLNNGEIKEYFLRQNAADVLGFS